jgi:hypothetical protein
MRTVASIVCVILAGLLFTNSAGAAGPLLLDYRTEGTGPATSWNTSAGVGGRLGSDAATCHHSDPNGDDSRPISLVVTLEPRDGGYVTLRYRFKSWYPTSGAQNGHANAFIITLRDPTTGVAGEEPLFVADYFAPSCQLRDTGWVTTSVYIRSWSNYNTPTRELWLTVLGRSIGYFPSDPSYHGTTTTSVEIEDLAAVCTGAASASSAAPTWSMQVPNTDVRRRARRERRLAGNAVPVSSTCTECCTKPLTPLDPGDADSATMESGYDAWFWLTRCSQGIQDGTACFRDAVQAAGHPFVLTSSLRTAWYQRHFREIWDKYQDLKDDATAACAAIKQSAIAEKQKHGIGYQPAGQVNPRHVNGEAIDISPKKMGLTLPALDVLADPCGLYRRVPSDKYHYEVKP